jgi:hypothetical protein
MGNDKFEYMRGNYPIWWPSTYATTILKGTSWYTCVGDFGILVQFDK